MCALPKISLEVTLACRVHVDICLKPKIHIESLLVYDDIDL